MPAMADPVLLLTWGATLLVFAPLLAGLLVYLLPGRRREAWVATATALGLLLPLAAVSVAALEAGPLTFAFGGHRAPLGIELAIDGLALAMLWLTAIIMLAVTCYTTSWLRDAPGFRATEFRVLVFLLWSGLNGLFLSADLFNLYVMLEIVTLTAVPLVVFSHGAAAIRAAMQYLVFALAGSIFYLLGVALIYAETGLLAISALGSAQLDGPGATVALAAMTTGLAMKAALFPVHAWLPTAHAVAPSPASALLSALVAKAAVYLLVRLWLGPFAGLGSTAVLQGLGAIGMAGMVYASLQALRQPKLKGVVAYSTVAQLGYFLLLLPLASLVAWQGVLYHGLVHGLAKTALFLAAGNLIRAAGSDRLDRLAGADRFLGGSLMAIALAGVSLAGLPPSGGFIGKWWLIQASLEADQWWWVIGIVVGGLLAAAYVFRVLRYGMIDPADASAGKPAETPGNVRPGMIWPPILLAVAAIVLGFTGDLLQPLLAIGGPGTIPGAGGTP